MKISPTFTFWITFITACAQGVTSGFVHLSGLVPEAMLPKVTGWMGVVVFVNMLFLSMCSGYSSPKAGPLAAAPTLPEAQAVMDAAKKAAVALLFAVLLFGVSDVRAQTPRATPRTTDLGLPCDFLNLLPGCKYVPPANAADSKPLDVWQAIAKAALPDLEYAKALSAAAGTPAAQVRGQCWDALIVANRRASGVGVKDAAGNVLTKPDPHLASDAESLAELVDDLDLKGPLAVACAGSAQMFKLSVLQLISGFVTGAAGLAALGAT